MGPAVDVIAEEQVIDVSDVTRRAGRAVFLEQAHEVAKLAMQVAEDLDGGWKWGVGGRGKDRR